MRRSQEQIALEDELFSIASSAIDDKDFNGRRYLVDALRDPCSYWRASLPEVIIDRWHRLSYESKLIAYIVAKHVINIKNKPLIEVINK